MASVEASARRESSERLAAKSVAEKTVFQRQIDVTDADIDRLVYNLYGLAEAEIKIVEGGTRRYALK